MSRVLATSMISFALVGTHARLEATGCEAPIVITSLTIGRAEAGAFDLSGTSFAGKGSPGPDIQFWAYGNFAVANSGTETQHESGSEWVTNPALDHGMKDLSSNLFSVFQANWFGSKVDGCIQEVALEKRRTVIEMSFADPGKEKSALHQGYYGIISVPAGPTGYDVDQVRGGEGPKGNHVKVQPIPAPAKVAVAGSAGGFVKVNLELSAPVSYSEGGKDTPVKLVKGYRVLFASDSEPLSSDPSGYKPALDPSNPESELGWVKPGSVTVAVPAGKPTWLVTQLVYEDPKPIYSRATSAHVKIGGPAEGGTRGHGGTGRKRGR